tara:strand:- start:7522 stop:7896 length:375 start_codon:yes stop_codon:yes gene_type:complete
MDTKIIENLLGEYSWLIITGFVLLIARSTIESVISGLKIFLGDDLNTDDVIIININGESRPARVVRVGLWKTILFVYEVGCADGKAYVKGGNKVAIQNDTLKDYIIEKPLPMLDLKKWDNCGDD